MELTCGVIAGGRSGRVPDWGLGIGILHLGEGYTIQHGTVSIFGTCASK